MMKVHLLKIMKKLLSITSVLALLLTSVSPVKAVSFPDLSPEDPYYQVMETLAARGIVQGDAQGNLNGDQPLLRAELVTIVVRAGNIEVLDSDKNCFPDVRSQWFAGAVCAMTRLELIKGYPDGSFLPGREVKSGEAAKIIINALTSLNFVNLDEAQAWLEQNQFYKASVGLEQSIVRKEAFARLLAVADNWQSVSQEQVGAEEDAFNAESDTMMLVESGGPVFYVEYNEDQYQQHLGQDPLILFFHAGWCPKCKASKEVILQNQEQLVGGAIIFQVDFDTELELRKEYGITLQDTFVAINAAGEVVEKNNAIGSSTEIQTLIDASLQ